MSKRRNKTSKLHHKELCTNNYAVRQDSQSNLLKLLEETPEAYYWVGFIMADGYINHSDFNRLSVRLQKSDQNHLEKLASFIESKLILKQYQDAIALDVRDTHAVKELIDKFDFKTDKTHNPPEKFPTENPDLFIAFLLGFIDGDGNVYKNSEGRFSISIGCHETWASTLNMYKFLAYKYLGLDTDNIAGSNSFKDRETEMAKISLSHQEFIKKLRLKQIELGVPIMERKWGKVDFKTKKYQTTVYIGRFQPFHKAHLKTIEKCLELSETLIISIGSAHRPRTIKNPWTAEEREVMIRRAISLFLEEEKGWTDFPKQIEKRIKFIHVRDHMYNNTKWAAELYSKALAAGATQGEGTALVGCFKDDSSFYLKMFPQWDFVEQKIMRFQGNIINATDIRDEMFEEKYLNPTQIIPETIYNDLAAWINTNPGEKLREEYSFINKYRERWKDAPYEPTFVTADAVVVKSGHVLMIQRKVNPGKGLWALPGGFVNPKERIKDAAFRELKEETKIMVPKAVLRRSVVDKQVFDHPHRSLRGRTITHAYLIDLEEGPLPHIKAADDAKDARWIPIADLYKFEETIFEDHIDIIKFLTSRF